MRRTRGRCCQRTPHGEVRRRGGVSSPGAGA
jgi:hypothetical protein